MRKHKIAFLNKGSATQNVNNVAKDVFGEKGATNNGNYSCW